jgi:phosphoribosyl-ATP pyrophosphohydrolase/phosphoribosyl-AMP cyclohydrolase
MNNITNKIDWKKCNGMVPAIIQDQKTFDVLMLGFMNEEALNLTLESKKVHFFSRTKNRIWMKGETSNHVLNLVDIDLDCDNDSLLVMVNPQGNTCHLGDKSCFKKRVNFLAQLEEIIDHRIENPLAESYVSKMHSKGLNKIVQKVGEEGVEVVIAALNEGDERLLSESADLMFHLLLLLRSKKLSITDVVDVLAKRSLK